MRAPLAYAWSELRGEDVDEGEEGAAVEGRRTRRAARLRRQPPAAAPRAAEEDGRAAIVAELGERLAEQPREGLQAGRLVAVGAEDVLVHRNSPRSVPRHVAPEDVLRVVHPAPRAPQAAGGRAGEAIDGRVVRAAVDDEGRGRRRRCGAQSKAAGQITEAREPSVGGLAGGRE